MYLTDEQIMLLEQLTYLTDDVADAAGVLLGPYDSVENLLQQFDDDALQRLEDPGNPDSTKDYTGGKKWAAIIRQIKSDPDLYSLDIVNKDDSVPAICFNDPDDPEHAVVVFRGTSGKDEWIDNAIGLGVSDTERQKAALDYIESYLLICFGIALSNRCGLPIVPTDLFPRELAQITGVGYSRIKIAFDTICLAVTVGITGIFLGQIKGLGVGTVLAAFTMGKTIGMMGKWLDRRFRFVLFSAGKLSHQV